MKKYILMFFSMVIMIFAICISSSAAEPEISVTTEHVNVTNAPEDSELIVALYSDDILVGTNVYSCNGTFTGEYAEDMQYSLENADTIKVFLWELSTLEVYGNAFEARLDELPDEKFNDALIVYFSATGNTEELAYKIVDVTGSDIYEIVPEDPYTSEDLNYSDDSCRANQEMNDPDARPAIAGGIDNIDEYSTIILGYPIWWGPMPRIINTFLDTYDLSGKTILPFCTSGSSGISQSVSALRNMCIQSDVTEGFRGTSLTTSAQIQNWLDSNGFYR